MSDLLAMQRSVWRSTRSTTEKIVLLAIIDFYSEASPEPWPSVSTLAAQTSLGRTAVLDAIAALDRDGVLAVKREFGRANRYDLSRVCAALAPVRQADQSGKRTGSPTTTVAKDPLAAAPPAASLEQAQAVRHTDQSATRTGSQNVENSRGNSPSDLEPVRHADSSATQTGTPDGRDQSAWRTGPVRLADTKEPMKEPKKEASRARARPPARVDEALALPVAERATLVIQRPREAQRLQPEQWPEVRKIAEAFASAVGRERKLSEFARDSGLRAIVALLAAGNSVDDVAWVAGNVPKQAWWRGDGRTRGLATLSPEVVARALEERDGVRAQRKTLPQGPPRQRAVSERAQLSAAPRELHAPRCVAALLTAIQRPAPVKCRDLQNTDSTDVAGG